LPWARVLLEIERGALDVASSASRSPERDTFALFSDPYRLAEVAIFVRKGEAGHYPLNSLADIRAQDFRLGIIVGYHYSPGFADLVQDPAFAAKVDGAAGYEVNINKLLLGRIDGFLVDDVGVMIGEAKKLGVQDQIERHPLPVANEYLHFMLSRKSVEPAMVDAMNASLARMKADGRLQAISDAYLK
jgi:polar amino acid transport system substrate-binding protein